MRSLAVTIALIAAIAQPHPVLAQRKDCGATELPKHLPPPSSILDSARAIAALSAYPSPAGGMVFTVMYDETDSVPSTWPLEVVDSQAIVPFAYTLRPKKPEGTWAVRVRVVGGETPAVTLERSIYCPPAPRDHVSSPFPVQTEIQMRPDDHLPPTTRPNRIDIEAQISEAGQVMTANLVQSTGIHDLDNDILTRFHMRHFYPALVDGMPVTGWYRTDGKAPRL
jgi:hypothetical protein